jgi:oligopeptidase B
MPSQVSLEKTRSGRFVVLSSDSSETSEVHLLDLHAPHAQLQCMQARVFGTLYSADHTGAWVVIVTNADGAKNFKLVVTPVGALGKKHWVPLPSVDSNVTAFDYHSAILNVREGAELSGYL